MSARPIFDLISVSASMPINGNSRQNLGTVGGWGGGGFGEVGGWRAAGTPPRPMLQQRQKVLAMAPFTRVPERAS